MFDCPFMRIICIFIFILTVVKTETLAFNDDLGGVALLAVLGSWGV